MRVTSLVIAAMTAGMFCLPALGEPPPAGGRAGDAATADQPREHGRPKSVRIRNAHKTSVMALAFSPDGKMLASGGHDKEVYMFDTATGKKIRTFSGVSENLRGINYITALTFSPDGKVLAVGHYRYPEIVLWDVTTGREQGRFIGSRVVAFSPDGKILATLVDGHVVVWDVARSKYLRLMTGHLHVYDVVFSPDGRSMVSSSDESVRVWDTATGKLLHEWDSWGQILAMSSDGKTLIEGGENGGVQVRDITTGKQLHTFDHLPGFDYQSGSLSLDGKLLVTSAGSGGNLQLWELATGTELWRQPNARSAVAFAPHHWRLAWGSERDITIVSDDGINLVQQQLPQPRQMHAKDLAALWNDLGNRDGRRAYRALGILRADPPSATAFLKQKLRPAPTPAKEQMKQWIADLDNDSFRARELAIRELQNIGEPARPFLEQTLSGKPTLEVHLRIQRLLTLLDEDEKQLSARALQRCRAIQLLEALGTREARALLHELAQGAPAARLTGDAQAALKRLGGVENTDLQKQR